MNNNIRVGITQGDVNGVGYEIILKVFVDPEMFDFCTPILYGSPKIATYHRKMVGSQTNFNVVDNADQSVAGRLNLVNCNAEEVKVDFVKMRQGDVALTFMGAYLPQVSLEDVDYNADNNGRFIELNYKNDILLVKVYRFLY